MRHLVVAVALAASLALGGSVAWKAEAAVPIAALPDAGPVHNIGCRAPGAHCPPGYRFVCGPYGHRCWCAPC